MSYYASFQGRVYLGERNANGDPINVRSPGNVADLSLSLKTDVIEHYESQTGQRAVDLRLVKQKSATVALTIEEFTKETSLWPSTAITKPAPAAVSPMSQSEAPPRSLAIATSSPIPRSRLCRWWIQQVRRLR